MESLEPSMVCVTALITATRYKLDRHVALVGVVKPFGVKECSSREAEAAKIGLDKS